MRVSGGAQQKQCGGTGGPGSERSAKNSARGYDSAKQIGFEKFSDKIRDGHGAPADQLHHFFFSEAADLAPDFQELPEVFLGRFFDYGRSEDEKFGGYGSGARNFFGKFDIFCAVFF